MKTNETKTLSGVVITAEDNTAYYIGLCNRAGVSPALNLPIHVLIGIHRKRNPKAAYSYIGI